MTPAVAFALAAALHAGFQLTVTLLVYPSLASRGAEEWRTAHAHHSRAITPLVAAVYGVLVVAGALLVLRGPGSLGWVALGSTAVALTLTAAVAAPLHGRLGSHDDRLVARLLLADRARCAAAVVGALAAAVAVVGG